MAGTIEAFFREADLTPVIGSISQTTLPEEQRRSQLNAAAERVAAQIRELLAQGSYARREILTYPSEENLLRHADRLTDFLILDLADHFRYYDWTPMPGFAGAVYASSTRDSKLVYKRMSGHVTGSFAEAMCPWVMEALGISRGSTFTRFASLAPGLWGNVMPDFVFWLHFGEVPCEAKHYSRGIRWSGVASAVVQVAAAMSVMRVKEGYIFMALDENTGQQRYRAEVVRLVS
jgi:hypothetical protein